ncbi:unnamed protein product [Bursaphelenchus xylophilus]|uniref:Probable pectate lyase F n=1 Tax=Bursaphelenchus xylophilus TaxID=6326 RepID=A0A1I7SJJ0_BURXY|nr:unnamed protein product [Bursaphelenchus xylophilus]CAG9105614.1 unnamed protein product [Bursaphelenchus xylophilus]
MKSISLGVLFLAAYVSAQFGTRPNPKSTQKVPKTIEVKAGAVFDGKMERYVSGFADGGIEEAQPPIFLLGDGATIQNIVFVSPVSDGIHCNGSCKIENVCVTGGGAKKAHNKVFQHNGGGTLTIKNFLGEDMGKLYRSCGNCNINGKYDRHVIIDTVKVTGPALTLAAVNGNYGDTAVFKNVQISGSVTSICQDTHGVNDETLPKDKTEYVTEKDDDQKVCNYKKSDIKKI